MAHEEQRKFCSKIKNIYPHMFRNVSVLDIGSLDINGNNRYLFTESNYMGLDISEGKNVDIICKGHLWNAKDNTYDVIISTECLEHDMFYKETLNNAIRMLKSNGLLLITCATTGRKEHGTINNKPKDSPFTINLDNWCFYYKNITKKDMHEAIDINNIFSEYLFSENKYTCDLYFYGIKH